MTEKELEQAAAKYLELSSRVIDDLRQKLAELSELVPEDKLKELHNKWGFSSCNV